MPQAALPRPVRIGAFVVDPRQRTLSKRGIRLKLHGQPFDILLLLLEHPGEVVKRDELQRRLWPANTFVDFENSLNAAIKKLRQALGDSADAPRYIETVPRVGYRLIAALEPLSPTLATKPPTPTPAEADVPIPRRRYVWLWVFAAISALAVSAGYEWRIHAAAPLPVRSIAVLPFEDLSGNPSQSYIADGMTDELTTDLAKIRSLRVISRTSAVHFRNTKETLPQIAQDLHADAIVEGTVEQSAGKVRVTAQLIDARDDHHLWAQSYDRDLGDVLTLQGQVAETIADHVAVKLTPEEHNSLSQPRPVNPKAYEDYVRGTAARDELSEDSLLRSIQDFNQAIQIDPRYAQGYAGLSHSYYMLGVFGYRPSAEVFPQARSLAQKALLLDGSSAEAYNTLAEVKRGYEWNWAGAEDDYKRAIALNPSYPNAHSEYALLLSMLGRQQQAIIEAQRDRELDPLAGQTETFIGLVLYRARRYGAAVEACRKGLAQDPDDPMGHWFLSLAYDQINRQQDAVTEARKAVELSPSDPFDLSKLGYALAVADQTKEARQVLYQLTAMSRRRYVPPLDFGFVYLGLGDKPAAMRYVEKAYEEHDNIEFLTFPAFDPLRSDTRFQAIMHQIGLPE